jgi:hypothetical protein
MQNRNPSSLARITRGRIPETPWISPFRLISPTTRTLLSNSGFRIPAAASTAAATGRSNPAPSFFISAGAKFTVTRFGGRLSRLFLNAVRTLSCASLTCADGKPTMVKEGKPSLTSASTWISRTSMPKIAADNTLANKFVLSARKIRTRSSDLSSFQLLMGKFQIDIF